MSDLTIARPMAGSRTSARPGGRLSATAAIPKVESRRDLPLSFAQERLWFLAQIEGGSKAYQNLVGFQLRGKLDRAALRRALNQIVARHETLRTVFGLADGKPLQRIADSHDSHFHLIENDLQECGGAAAELERLITTEAGTPIDLEAGPLIRGRLVRQGDEEHVLLITIHHIVSDAWSFGLLSKELSSLYGAYVRGEEDPLPELGVQYADYAMWQRKWMEGEVLGKQAEYWKKALAGAPEVLQLPTDHARPEQQNYSGAVARVVLDEELTAGLKRLGRKHKTTLYMTVLAGWAALLARLSGQDEVVIGTPVANRNRVEIERLVGFFVNALALRLGVSDSFDVGALLAQVRSQAIAAQEHQAIPFEQVVEIVQPPRSLAHNPVFQVVFAWQNAPKGTIELAGLQVSPFTAVPHDISKFDLTLSLQEEGTQIVGELEYATALYERSTIERYIGYFRNLLGAMVADDSQKVDRLRMLPQEERQQLLYEWNAKQAEFPQDKCVHELFEEQVEKTPQAVAVVFENEFLSYGELNRRANQLAHYLRELGVRPDERVAICVERGLEMVAGILGILKAGAAYVPLDPAYPAERLRFMLEDSAPTALLTQSHLEKLFAGINSNLPVLDLESATPPWREQPETNPAAAAVGLGPQHLAYVIYTSGSTGTPKGVLVEHANVVRLLTATEAWFHFGGNDVWTLFHSYGFDFSVWEIWGCLCYGGRLVVVPKTVVQSPEDFYQLLCKEKVTVLNQTPSAFRQLIGARAASAEANRLQWVIFGGEALEVASLKPWYEQNSEHGPQLVNMYGITETTVHVTYRPLKLEDTERRGGSPIGCRIPDLRVYILDAHGEPVPVGVTGELYVGGAGVARGYLNRPELTAQKFLKDPYTEDANGRMYRTGDLGRWLGDGSIEFLGRNDLQVKIRGFRIELGEIEARLMEHPSVREAVVVAREDSGGEKRLVAYYTAADPGSDRDTADAEQLRSHLSCALPEYMVPAAYVRLEALPLTPNGKLDRKALPAPDSDAYATAGYEPPQGESETIVAAIWADLLKLDRVGRHDNFFSLGGHSLMAVTLIGRMRRAGLGVDVRSVFMTPTLAALAAAASTESGTVEVPANLVPAGCERITPGMLPLVQLSQEEIDRVAAAVPGGMENVQDIYPLMPLQEGILFHHLMSSEGDPYLIAAELSFDTRARLDKYLEAMQAVIDRHDILRTAVMWEGLSIPVQVVVRKALLAIEEVVLDAVDGDMAEQLYARFNPRHCRIDVDQAPLMRIYVAEDTNNDRWLMLQHWHHLTIDHLTEEVIKQEVAAHLLGQQRQLPAPVPFRNLVAQARLGVSQQEHEAFFREMLRDVDEPTAPFGLLDVHGDGSGIEKAHLAVDAKLGRRLRSSARKLGVSLASICHVAWAQVLAKTSGREDVVFGTVLFGRMQEGEKADRVMGLFVNTLPVRMRAGEESVESAVRKMHALLANLLRHEHASLTMAQRCSLVPAGAPLFSALLNCRHNYAADQQPSEEVLQAWQGIRWLRLEERTNYPFILSVDDYGQGLGLTAQVPAWIGPLRICQFMRTALASLAETLEKSPATPLHALPILPEQERHRVLYDWNQTQVEFPSDKCVHELFEEQAARTPDAVAVVFDDGELSYGELNRRANRLAHSLRELGVKPDERVAICLERSLEMVIALMAVLKAGGAYVPLDPEYPAERLRYMLEDSGAGLVLTQKKLTAKVLGEIGAKAPLVEVDEVSLWERGADENPARAETGLTSSHLAYLIYTSGSTGQPKGVAIEHRNTVNLICWAQKAFSAEVMKHTLFATSLNFDLAVYECFVPLSRGTSIRIVRDVLEAGRARRDLTLINTVPSAMSALLDAKQVPATVRMINLAGEPLKKVLVERIFAHTQAEAVGNLYGPTETTTYSTAVVMKREEKFAAHIGRPIANTQVYILDRYQEPVPVGVAGEVYIGGGGVARGYLNSPELTKAKFLRDPFREDGKGRMYRTGDRGRWLGDGNIEFLGRNDFQVKIRGFRIELGEIETRLVEHPAVREAVVVVGEKGSGDKRLVAYYTTVVKDGPEGNALGAEQLRAHLSASLPEYMVPAAYVRLESLPLTPNGKLDRKALPAPEGDAYAVRQYEAPQGAVEELLAGIWAELLKVERVGRHDSFFDLGGHSLLAVRAIARVRGALKVEVAIRDLFEWPVLEDFAGALASAAPAELPAIPRTPRGERIPLSLAQQRLWFLAQMEGVSEAYHIRTGLYLHGELNRAGLRWALDRLVARHEALRTTFAFVEGEPVQQIAPSEESRFHLVEYDLRGQSDVGEDLKRMVAEESAKAFDMQAGPLIRGRLVRLADEEDALLITMHHIVSDGWSMGVFTSELSTLYKAFLRGEANPLPELKIQYADYAVWQRKWLEGEVLGKQAEYWKKALAGAPELLQLPADHVRPEQQNFNGAVARVVLEEELAAGLKALGRKHGTTLYMTVLAGWAALLTRLSGQDEVVIGTPVANRNRVEIEGLIGFFVNTLALRLCVCGTTTVGELLEQVKGQVLAAQEHQDLPFEQVVEIVRPPRSLAHNPVFQVMFSWQNAPKGIVDFAGLQVSPFTAFPHDISKFDLMLSLREEGRQIVGVVEYATALYERSTIERYIGYFRNLLGAMVADGSQKVDRLPMLSQEERRQLLYDWNATEAEYPRDKRVHELFEEQAEKTPDAIAIVYQEQALTYGELNRHANRLAHYLRELGVRPDERVAICAERGLEIVVGLLAVLKAGGAYVPLDPAYPAERLRFMLEDSAPVVVLTQTRLGNSLMGSGNDRPMVMLDDEGAGWMTSSSDRNPGCDGIGVTAQNLACIIYTSGSTGTSKGVAVQHGGIVNLVHDWTTRLGNRVRRDALQASLWTSFGFDVSIFELFAGFYLSATVNIVPERIRGDSRALSAWFVAHGIAFGYLPPFFIRDAYADASISKLPLKLVLVGVEPSLEAALYQLERNSPGLQIVNGYGPAETTVFSTTYPEIGNRPRNTPIGRPLANTRIYILDPYGEPVPVGVTGELYIGGAGVARGYLSRPELTAERFVRDPFTAEAGARMYRTGDLGRRLADGNIEFLGRNDFQVKIRGFRIELGEIEARLSEHAGVQEAVVLAREDRPGDKRLVAYYTAKEQNSVGAQELRTHVAAKLPEYMVPAAYVRLEALPLTPNGKLNRKALPAPEGDAYAVRQYEAPQGAIEELLADIWAKLLHLERVGRHDNFFELGGHSLMVVTLVERLAQAGLKADVRALFTTPTLAKLAASFDTNAPALETPANRIPSPEKNTSSPHIVELSI